MRSRLVALKAVVALAFGVAAAFPVAASAGANSSRSNTVHGHSSQSDGGATLTPTTLNVSSQGVVGALHNSTWTVLDGNAVNLATTTLVYGIWQSTITMRVSAGRRLRFEFTGSIRQGNAGDHVMIGVLQDGVLYHGQTNARGLWVLHGQGSPTFHGGPLIFTSTWTYPTAGEHTFALTGKVTANSYQFCSNATATAQVPCVWRVSEVR